MHARLTKLNGMVLMVGALALTLATAGSAFGHCDSMEGPVVKDAQAALEKGDVTAILKWVPKTDEEQIRQAFQKTLIVRAKGPEAKALADMYFFETLARVHRASEGAPYTGLRPVGTEIEPSIKASDKALESGSADEVTKMLTEAVTKGIQERFAKAKETRAHADESVEAGRKAVAAYVEFTHYVERLHADASGEADTAHAGHGEAAALPGPSRMGWTTFGIAAVLVVGVGFMFVSRRNR